MEGVFTALRPVQGKFFFVLFLFFCSFCFLFRGLWLVLRVAVCAVFSCPLSTIDETFAAGVPLAPVALGSLSLSVCVRERVCVCPTVVEHFWCDVGMVHHTPLLSGAVCIFCRDWDYLEQDTNYWKQQLWATHDQVECEVMQGMHDQGLPVVKVRRRVPREYDTSWGREWETTIQTVFCVTSPVPAIISTCFL